MSHPVSEASSPVFDGPVGQAFEPRSFPGKNYIRNRAIHPCEGDWAFCLLDGQEVHAARFGFTTGPCDYTDYGAADVLPASNLQVHIELLTRDGAILWHGSGLHDGRQLQSAPDRLEMSMQADGKKLFHVAGWPQVRWSMQCSDADLSLEATLDLDRVLILPDAVLPRMTFSMWLATGAIQGRCVVDGKTMPLNGKVFYDHLRITNRPNDVPPFGLYYYTPTVLADGSQLVSYYSRGRSNQWVPGYSFAYWVRPGLPVISLRSVDFKELAFDSDRQLHHWRQVWEGEGIRMEGECVVTSKAIARLWGGPGIMPSRQSNPSIPLPFDSRLTIHHHGQTTHTTGRGLAECVAHPELARTLNTPT